jgi:predicted dehydrogenase
LVGDITSVSALLGVFIDRPGVDGGVIDPANDSALLQVKFDNGAHGTIQASGVAYVPGRSNKQQIRLYGEAGSIEADIVMWGPKADTVIRAARSQDEQFQILEVPDSFWGDADPSDNSSIFAKNSVGTRAFIDTILEDRPVEPNFYDGYKAQQVIDAAFESHELGSVVSIDNSL